MGMTKSMRRGSLLGTLALIGATLLPAVASGQSGRAVSRADAHPKAVRDYETGVQAAFKRDDRNAVRYLEAALRREPDFADALVELAGVLYNRGDFAAAEPYLARVVALGGDEGERALYGLALAQLKQDKFAQAATHLARYLEREGLREDRRAAAERYLAQARFRAESAAAPVALDLHRLPPAINTPADAEYLPSLTADGRTLVFTRRVGNRQEDFFASRRDSVGAPWSAATPLTGVNTLDNEGAQTISADGKLLVYTACNRPDGLGSCDLYYSNFRHGAWSPPANLGPPVNTDGWESQPSLAANGNLLFFAARRKGGQGGADLYASGRTPEGGWTEPINLGPTVNTPQDDQAPFFHADGRTLYFMSEGHPGMGGFDLFVTRLGEDKAWNEPVNLGYPVNTEGNEGALAVALDGRTAYFATDAAGALAAGDSIGVGGGRSGVTDLFRFTLPERARAGVVTYVRATVLDAATGLPVAAAATFADAATDAPYVRRRASEADGTFLAVLPAGKTYALAVEEPGYAFYSDRFALDEPADAERPFELTIRLQPLSYEEMAPASSGQPVAVEERAPVVLRNVLFATGSADLLPASRAELERLAALLRGNPELRIRIQGHTDDVGDEASNQDLSERRAAAVRDFLVAELQIAADRLGSVGFGESQPLVPNRDDASRALNRRTEFVVVR